ncbi:hypothetical protein A6U87_15885 [Rhizobium sp. AC44/96]|nr:hypothetical protein A6U87_15885 [Rhizobium sp. AC44/96]
MGGKMDTSSWSGLFVSLVGTPEAILFYLSGINWYALGIAVLSPLLMLFARQEIRLRRLRSIQDFLTTFKLPGVKGTTLSTEPRSADTVPNADPTNDNSTTKAAPGAENQPNPSFEYVKSKYISDLRLSAKYDDQQRLKDAKTDVDRINIYIEIACRPFQSANVRLYLASLSFMLVSYYGFKLFFTALGYGTGVECVPATGCNLTLSETIGAFAFVGAYVAALRMLLRSLAIFDLNAFTFLRQAGEMAATVLVVILLYNAFPTITAPVSLSGIVNVQQTTGTASPETAGVEPQAAAKEAPTNDSTDDDRISSVWLALAVLLGLLPQSSSKFLLLKLRAFVPWAKIADDRFAEITKTVSPDIIDGIDFETRFRLEECGIYDVQNLATYNPIMLFIETPFGVFQCIDWVAQAQLCHILGPEKFLTFRELNIRTIFDLERAIESMQAPDAYDAMCATVLLAPTQNLRSITEISGFKFFIGRPDAPKAETLDQYFEWLNSRIADKNGTTAAIEHLMSWIGDDLHVRRLRRLWNDIADSLEPNSEYLKDSKRNPANAMKHAAE